MARRRVTVELDDNLVDATRAVAERTGVAERELYERALRKVLVRDFTALMNDIAADQAGSETLGRVCTAPVEARLSTSVGGPVRH